MSNGFLIKSADGLAQLAFSMLAWLSLLRALFAQFLLIAMVKPIYVVNR